MTDMNGEVYIDPGFEPVIITPPPAALEPEEVILPPAPVEEEPVPEPASPLEVISVEDLLGRLDQEEPQPLSPEDTGDIQSGSQLDGELYTEEDTDTVELLQQTADHPMMETPFEAYTVTEGLLLLIFILLFLDFFLNLLRRWF